jgi:hypothetical protein
MPKPEPPPKLPHSAIPARTYPVAHYLPDPVCLGIGKVVSAHAVLENEVFELLVSLSGIRHPIGRVMLRYQGANERFKTCRRLMVLHGISLGTSMKKLYERIDDCCRAGINWHTAYGS